MSNYGPPDPGQPAQPDPYGSTPPPPPNPYGAPPAPNPYGAPPQPAYGTPTPGLPPEAYAHWGKRVGALLIDALLTMVAAIPLWIGYGIVIAGADTTTSADGTVTITNNDMSPAALVLILIGFVTYVGFYIWNTFIKAGRTGYSIGKGVMGIKLIKIETGQPIGAGLAFVRQIAHFVDAIICYIGYLFPLWDSRRQTLADKIMSTVVINQPK